MCVRKISLKITCLLVAAVGLSGTISTLNLMKNNIPTTFAQPMTTAANSNQGILTTSLANAAGSKGIFHVAIFRFAKEHVNDAMAAFRALASASRRELGNLGYDIYRGIDDNQEFYIVEHWASPAALAAHERSEAFIHFGQSMLGRYATLHDTVTARAFDVSPFEQRRGQVA
jgi:quinol monooxygenase YgiN